MLIGHIAVALGSKKVAPKTSFGTLLLAAQWPDLIWPLFLALGWERVRIVPGLMAASPLDFTSYPLTHSLLADFGWGLLLGGLYLIFKKNRRGALLIWACVVSHWFLDAIVHRPDLPLYPGSQYLAGLGLWNSVMGTVLVEGGMFVAGAIIYSRATRAKDKIGEYSYKTFIALLVLIYLTSLMGPPPSVTAIEWAGVFSWLFVAWAYWIDEHRTTANLPEATSDPSSWEP